jgi:hypothetical protein
VEVCRRVGVTALTETVWSADERDLRVVVQTMQFPLREDVRGPFGRASGTGYRRYIATSCAQSAGLCGQRTAPRICA